MSGMSPGIHFFIQWQIFGSHFHQNLIGVLKVTIWMIKILGQYDKYLKIWNHLNILPQQHSLKGSFNSNLFCMHDICHGSMCLPTSFSQTAIHICRYRNCLFHVKGSRALVSGAHKELFGLRIMLETLWSWYETIHISPEHFGMESIPATFLWTKMHTSI